ncbi:hypothetical protein VNO77_14701 [Canavalia gladiata]|uniref:RING-type domain-containing protein n=1 Tax=Canavalia gladiata TaxID=3824 RepID=A0AAN9LZK8_CANGL
MNSTSNSDDNPSKEPYGYAYYLVALSFGVLLVIIVIILISNYLSHKSLQNRQVSGTANTSMEQDSALTIQIHEGEAVVNNYPVLLYSQAKKHKPDSETITSYSCCSICLADYKDTDWLKLLPHCGHLFHRDCIDRWLQVNLSCPMCRNSPLPTPLAEVTPLATRP